jgi:hypothetical protein
VETPAAAATPVASPAAVKKVVKRHRPANATYVNGTYGVSFSYPRKYSLQSGDKTTEIPVEANFVKPGAVEIASVDMPDTGYPDTDFSSALLNVSVNQGLTADECSEFAGTAKDQPAQSESAAPKSTAGNDSSGKAPEALKPTAIKLGTNEFSEIEQMKGAGEKQSDLKYFHLFKNGACYEFALDVETSRKADEDLAQVDRGQVFKQLEKILTTARIKNVELPGVEKINEATASQTSATPNQGAAITEVVNSRAATATPQENKAQVVTPEHK